MAKNNDRTWIGVIILAVIIIYGGQNGWFQFSFNLDNLYPPASHEKEIELEKPPTTLETCTLSITPLAVFSGDSVTGIIQDGNNRFCEVYAKSTEPYSPTWRLIYSGNTDDTGRLSSTQSISLVGVFTFKALCGSCRTNEVTLTVNPLPDESLTCSQKASAGGYFYYEPISSEFNCNSKAIEECQKKGLAGKTYLLDGDCCLFTCQSAAAPLCVDTDGGKNREVKGTCTDSSNTPGETDYCRSTSEVQDFYCDTSNTCKPSGLICATGTVCSDGACIKIDTDGDGYSDEDETAAGTNPNDSNSYPGGPLETCANSCMNIGYHGAHYPGVSLNSCQSYAYETCFPVHGLQFEASTYLPSGNCCCFECVGW